MRQVVLFALFPLALFAQSADDNSTDDSTGDSADSSGDSSSDGSAVAATVMQKPARVSTGEDTSSLSTMASDPTARSVPVMDNMATAFVGQTVATDVSYDALKSKYLNWPTPAAPFIKCSVRSITFDKVVAHKYPISCQLSAQPQSTVLVFMEAYGIKFSTCYLQFDASSWSTPQQFDVLPRAALFKVDVTTSPIYMLPYAPSEAYNNKLFTIPLSTVSRAQAACGVTPDGSITTILAAPNPLSFTGLLGYTIVDSTAGLRILGKMDKSSALAGVIVQYFKSEYLVSYPLGFAELVYVNAGSSTDGTFVSLSADNATVTISLEDSTVVTVNLASMKGPSGTLYALSLDILLSPAHYRKTSGLCGLWDDALDGSKLVCGSQTWPRTDTGKTGTDPNTAAFANCFKSNLYDKKPLVGVDYSIMIVPTYCQIPSLSKSDPRPSPPSSSPPANTSPSGPGYGSPPVIARATAPTANTCTIVHKAADDICRITVNDGITPCGLSAEPYIQTCITDVLSTCLLDLSSAYQDAYNQECHSKGKTDSDGVPYSFDSPSLPAKSKQLNGTNSSTLPNYNSTIAGNDTQSTGQMAVFSLTLLAVGLGVLMY